LFDDAAACAGLQPDFSLGLMQPNQQPDELQAAAIPAIES
jgi:hypothetical protein